MNEQGAASGTSHVGLCGQSSALRRLRRAAGLSQIALAAAISRSQPYISALERGEVQPTTADVALLNSVLGADFSVYYPFARKAHG